jgi:ubiquinone/menaquinone biosynthesis C-methylase UbiE
MSFDRVAGIYRLLEYGAFGRELERRRSAFIGHMRNARRALIIGDGDGRFTADLATHNPGVRIDSIDLSRKMLHLAHRRLFERQIESPERVRFIEGDVRSVEIPGSGYDLVSTHFVFDVFNETDLQLVTRRILSTVSPQCLWAVSEFDIPCRGWQRAHAEIWVKTMYLFFRHAAGLENQRLRNWRAMLAGHGFVCSESESARAGLIISELWQNSALAPLRGHGDPTDV